MLLKYFYDQELAHASYIVGCQKMGEAIVVDPSRNIQSYLDVAKQEKMKIVGSVETHIHADYVSGGRELAERIGSKLYVSDEGPADWKYTFVKEYNHQLLKDGDEFHVGNIKIETLHTPGHTPESLSFLLTDVGGGADRPMGLFTGDFIFVGSTGRPDLLEEVAGQTGTTEPGARDLYRSIQKFRELPDYLQVWPSHGAGSACGKGLGAIPSSTVGYEKMFNEALQFKTEDEFVQYILADQPEAPEYFATMKHVNKHGPKVLGADDELKKMDVADLLKAIESDMVWDVSPAPKYAQQHAAGTINIPTKYIARDGGWIVDYERSFYLIADSTTLTESIRVFREIGADNIAGYFDADEIAAAGLATESYQYKTSSELRRQIKTGDVYLVDVRRRAEWNEGHVAQAAYSFLGSMMQDIGSLPNDKPIVFLCRTGARSAVACSIAQAAGIKDVVNVDGGIVAWKDNGYPVETGDS